MANMKGEVGIAASVVSYVTSPPRAQTEKLVEVDSATGSTLNNNGERETLLS
ncbi:unnamed protein product [Sphenostylis stenocarpa]|uniref:Uncharacterized protein n=1 Tax=Sphenostylis stenocarpa TaxID=92480 RepID=A0AA86SUT8_9FABA|nr:unnamed protein product [Sphenostylis stenocarpa]